eukprot:3067258-Amphidinium_carterae.1
MEAQGLALERALGHVVALSSDGLATIQSAVHSCGDWAGALRYQCRPLHRLNLGDAVTFIPNCNIAGESWAGE